MAGIKIEKGNTVCSVVSSGTERAPSVRTMTLLIYGIDDPVCVTVGVFLGSVREH